MDYTNHTTCNVQNCSMRLLLSFIEVATNGKTMAVDSDKWWHSEYARKRWKTLKSQSTLKPFPFFKFIEILRLPFQIVAVFLFWSPSSLLLSSTIFKHQRNTHRLIELWNYLQGKWFFHWLHLSIIRILEKKWVQGNQMNKRNKVTHSNERVKRLLKQWYFLALRFAHFLS